MGYCARSRGLADDVYACLRGCFAGGKRLRYGVGFARVIYYIACMHAFPRVREEERVREVLW